MSTRSSIQPTTVIDAQSMAADITSSATILDKLTFCSYQATWSGTSPVGTLSIQGSSDYALNPDGTVRNSGTWSPLTVMVGGTPSSTVSVTGNTGSALIDIKTGIWAIRLIYTRVSGTGTMSAKINAKVS